jgi:hypothetical protein
LAHGVARAVQVHPFDGMSGEFRPISPPKAIYRPGRRNTSVTTAWSRPLSGPIRTAATDPNTIVSRMSGCCASACFKAAGAVVTVQRIDRL